MWAKIEQDYKNHIKWQRSNEKCLVKLGYVILYVILCIRACAQYNFVSLYINKSSADLRAPRHFKKLVYGGRIRDKHVFPTCMGTLGIFSSVDKNVRCKTSKSNYFYVWSQAALFLTRTLAATLFQRFIMFYFYVFLLPSSLEARV